MHDLKAIVRKRDPELVAYVSRKLISNRVKLVGLKNRADLNDLEGVVQGYHDETACFMIDCDNGERLRVKFRNLQFLKTEVKNKDPSEPVNTFAPELCSFFDLPSEEAELLATTDIIETRQWERSPDTKRALAAVRPNTKGAGIPVPRRGVKRDYRMKAALAMLALCAAIVYACYRP